MKYLQALSITLLVTLVALGGAVPAWSTEAEHTHDHDPGDCSSPDRRARYNEFLLQNIPPPVPKYTAAGVGAGPSQIRLSWQGDTARTMTITWSTVGSNRAEVRYGLTSSYELGTVRGISANAPFSNSGVVHTVELTGLSPNTTYYYQASGDAANTWSATQQFTTTKVDRTDFTFLGCGDSRQWLLWPLGDLSGWSRIATRMAAENASHVLICGDLTYDTETEPYWNDFLDKTEIFAARKPFMPAVGNHDDDDMNVWRTYFSLPQVPGAGEEWYSYDVEGVHFISLNNQRAEDPNQIAWLRADLAANRDALWTIVYCHRPPYTSGTGQGYHGPDTDTVRYLVPIFDEFKVDLVFTSHNHFYQRNYPLVGGANPSNPTIVSRDPGTYTNPQGTIYLVLGVCGAPWVGYTADKQKDYVATFTNFKNHYGKFRVLSHELTAQIIDEDGNQIDQFVIRKPNQVTPTVPPTATSSPTPEATDTPTETPTLEPTATPSPTYTSEPTATPTGSPVSISLRTNQSDYRQTDTLRVFWQMWNRTSTRRDVDVYLAAEVAGQFYFHPSYSTWAEPAEQLSLLPNTTLPEVEVLSLFLKDAIPGEVPLTWWAAMLERSNGQLLGDLPSAPIRLLP